MAYLCRKLNAYCLLSCREHACSDDLLHFPTHRDFASRSRSSKRGIHKSTAMPSLNVIAKNIFWDIASYKVVTFQTHLWPWLKVKVIELRFAKSLITFATLQTNKNTCGSIRHGQITQFEMVSKLTGEKPTLYLLSRSPFLKSFPNVAIETVPMLVWLTTAQSIVLSG